jgi:hypothetical protein
MKYLLFIILLFLSGCYVPYLYYTPENKQELRYNRCTLYEDNSVEVYVRLPRDTGIDVFSRLAVHSKTNNTVYVKELNFHITEVNTQKDVDSKVTLFACGKDFFGSNFEQLPDSLKTITKQGFGVGISLNFNNSKFEKYKALSVKCHALIIVNGQEIAVDKTIPVNKNYHWNLYSGD